MRYEGFSNYFVKDFWVNICNKDIHPVGWCATSGKPLVPPKSKFKMESRTTRYSRKVPGLFLLCHLFSKKKVKTLYTSGENIFLHNNIYI